MRKLSDRILQEPRIAGHVGFGSAASVTPQSVAGRPPAVGRSLLLATWLLGSVLALSSSALGQLRWETFVHGGETWCLVDRGTELWAGTSGGIQVYRAVGGQVGVQQPQTGQGMPAGGVSAICFHGDAMWVGTRTGTVARLDLETAKWAVYDHRAGFPSAAVTAIADDGLDLWAATDGGGVARFNVLRQDWEVYDTEDGLPDNHVLSMVADGRGLWAGTAAGLARYERTRFSWEKVAPQQGLDGAVVSLARSEANLWIASRSDGLSRIQLANGAYTRYDLAGFGVNRVDAVALSGPGNVWAATDQGLLMVPQEDAAERPWTLVEKSIGVATAMQVDDEDVWVATRSSGVWRYRILSEAWEQYAPSDALPSGELTALAAQAGYGWLGFASDGLARYDLARARWDNFTPPADVPRQVRDVAAFDQYVYCACADGIAVFDQNAGHWTSRKTAYDADLLGDSWTSVVATSTTVWFAGPGRVALFTPQMELLTTFQFPTLEGDREGTLPRLHLDRSANTVWVYGRGGAWRYQPQLGTWSEFGQELFESARPGLYQREGRLIRAMDSDAESVWFVTLDGVLQYWRESNQLWQWDDGHARGLQSARVIGCSRNQVWVAGRDGLYAYRRDRPGWIVYDWEASGLAGSEPTALAADGEEPYVWVASPLGVARLELLEQGARWQPFGRETGLVPQVRQIVPTPYAVWFLGQDGVTVYRREARQP